MLRERPIRMGGLKVSLRRRPSASKARPCGLDELVELTKGDGLHRRHAGRRVGRRHCRSCVACKLGRFGRVFKILPYRSVGAELL